MMEEIYSVTPSHDIPITTSGVIGVRVVELFVNNWGGGGGGG